jgi:hypothetical protein
MHVVVGGWPGAGKSTLARALAAELAVPLLAKDVIDRELARSRCLARAARRHHGHLDRDRSEGELWGRPVPPLGVGPLIQVDTGGPVDVASLARRIREAAERPGGPRDPDAVS